MAEEFTHEIVIPTDPLFAWVYVFKEMTGPSYIAPHWHEGIELSFTIHGQIDAFTIGGEKIQTSPGRILVVNTQEIHSVKSLSKASDLTLSIIYPFSEIRSLYPQLDDQLIDINHPEKFDSGQRVAYTELQGLLWQITELFQSDLAIKNIRITRLLVEVLELLLTHFTVPKKSAQLEAGRKEYAVTRLQQVTQYVNNHYMDEISLKDLAEYCGVSKEYLSRFFKKEMELTIDGYINLVRAQNAHKMLLGAPKTSLTDLALTNGFSGVRSLNRAFERIYGETASDFKRNLRKNGQIDQSAPKNS